MSEVGTPGAPLEVGTPTTPGGVLGDDEYRNIEDELELLSIIGVGMFSTVRLVKRKNDSKFFALKTMKKAELLKLDQVEHIISERNTMMQTNHPMIVRLEEVFQDKTSIHFLMDYIPGGELFTHLRQHTCFSNNDAKFYAGAVLLVIEHLHGLGILYRDLKPENILLDANGYPKFTDFGFSKKTERTFTLCGTPEYIAPEIIQKRGHGFAADFWALGILIYEMIVGYPPFYHDTPFGLYQKVLAGRCDYPRTFDTYAKDLVQRLLVLDPEKRLCNVSEVKSHKWFNGFDFYALSCGLIPAPIRPSVAGPDDVSNYESYPETKDNDIGDYSQKPFKCFAR